MIFSGLPDSSVSPPRGVLTNIKAGAYRRYCAAASSGV